MAERTLVVNIIGDSAVAERAFAKTATAAEASASAVEKAGVRMTSAGTAMAAAGKKLSTHVTLPIVAVGAAAAKMSLDFNKSMLQVSTQAGGSEREVKKLSAAILKLSGEGRFAQGPQELSEALFDIESSGYRGAKALSALKASSDLATVGGADLEGTTSALVGTLKTGVHGAENMHKAIGTLNATIGAGKMHMEDLNAAIGTGFLGTAKGLGVNLISVGAALAELTAQGVPASAAATRLRMTMSLMANPTEKAKKALDGIGIGSEDLAKGMRTPAGILNALELLQEHLTGLTKVEQGQLLAEAFGGAKSGGTIVQLLGQLDDLSAKQKQITQNTGDIGSAIAATNKDAAVELEKEWSALKAEMIEFGDEVIPAVLPVVKEIGHDIGSVAHAFEGLSPSTQSWIVKLGLATAALGPLLSIGGNLLKVFGGLATVTGKVGRTVGLIEAEQAAGGAAGAGSVRGAAGSAAASAAGARWIGAPVASTTVKDVGMFGEKQALKDAGLVAAGSGGAAAGVSGLVLPVTLFIGAAVVNKDLRGKLEDAVGGSKGGGILDTVLGAEKYVNPVAALGDDIKGIKGIVDPKTEKLGKFSSTLTDGFKSAMKGLSTDAVLGMEAVNYDLYKGMHAASNTWETGTKGWRAHTAEAMQGAVAAIRSGIRDGTIDAKRGHDEINNLLARIHLVKGNDPFGLAQATAKSFKDTNGITADGVKSWAAKLGQMPVHARESSIDSTQEMLHAWAKGHPKIEHEIDSLTDFQIHKFGATNKQLREGVEQGATGPVADAYRELAEGVGGALQNIGTNTTDLLKVLGMKSIGEFEVTQIGNGKMFTSHKESQGDLHKGHRAAGGRVNKRQLYEVGEEAPQHHEWVIATNPAYKPDNVGYWMQAGHDLGIPGFKEGGLPHPEISGGAQGLRGLGQMSIDDVWGVSSKVIAAARKRQAQQAAGGGMYTGPTPAGVGFWGGYPVDKWIIPELNYARAHGWSGPITSGYRTPQHSAELGFPGDEHTKTSYPGGAVDFGGMDDPAGAANRAAFIAATKGYKGPRLQLPIGFQDDGHMSGTGHYKGGLLGFKKGGKLTPISGAGVHTPEEWAAEMLLFGFPQEAKVIAEGLGVLNAEGGFATNPGGDGAHFGGWQEDGSFGSVADRLNPRISTERAAARWSADGKSFYPAWGRWEAEQGGADGSKNMAYLGAAENVLKAMTESGSAKGAKKLSEYEYGLQGYDPGGGHHPHARTPVELPGLKPGAVTGAAANLPKAFQGLLSIPGLKHAQRVEIGQQALSQAELTSDTSDDVAAAKFLLTLEDPNRKRIKKRIAQIKRELQKPMSPGHRKKLVGEYQSLVGQLGDTSAEIAHLKDTIRHPGGEPAEAEETDQEKADKEEQQKAIEATERLTAAIEAQAEIQRNLEKELRQTRELSERAMQSNDAVAWRALADKLSGHLGARAFETSQLAGNGSIGGF